MRRQAILAVVVGIGVVFAVGVAVWANAHGLIGFGGGGRRLLTQAQRAIQQGEWPVAQAKLEELVKTFPDSSWADDALLQLGGVYEHDQHLLEAQATYRLLVNRFPNSPLVVQAQERLGAVNVALLFSHATAEGDLAYDVKPGDTLGKIAEHYHTTVELLKKANGLSGDVIRPGHALKIPKGRFSIVVDKSQNQLLLTEDEQFFKTYPVATGTNGSTPVGAFKVINKIPHPVWYRQGAVVPPNSPENILGTRWLGLDKQGYGIHGSVDPSGIGKQITAGCVRMRNEDVEELYAIVPVGTPVTIVD